MADGEAGTVAGETIRSMLTEMSKTISPGTTTTIPKNTRTEVRIGSITRNTGEMRSTVTRPLPRSMGSSAPDPGPGRLHCQPGVTIRAEPETGGAAGRLNYQPAVRAVPVTEGMEGFKQVTSIAEVEVRAA